ncbi:uncharacterized protein LOC123550261 [Mercenaria mercenaria]|uniref:uncharacterized protein LOC123550261 n=1 Tax=Mercenaria mercenaria TaxID=6596 RepID=UPI00234EB6F8|nr:uncharacterized protein LOC123550261 [Mercenaria mercenaria]
MQQLLLLLVLILFGIAVAKDETEDIPTYYMHELCGKSISLRRQSIFSAKIELLPAAIINQTRPEVKNSVQGYRNTAHCILSFESWSFQNRLMVHFEEITLQSDQECLGPSLEIFDGPSEDSPRVPGFPSLCIHAGNFMSRSFVTTDKDMTLRFHGNHTSDRNAVIRAIIVSFNGGTCRSYEHECFNGRCIMKDLVCNGHNPCGDNSDCLTTVPPQEVARAKDDHVMLAAIIASSATLVTIAVLVIVLYRCYKIRHKHRRLHYQNHYETVNSNMARSENLADLQPAYERSVSQIEAEIRFAPPSYSQLPVLENQPEIEEAEDTTDTEEPLPNEIDLNKCLEPDENNPPSYACVMLCQEAFHVSEQSINRLTTQMTESDASEDADDESHDKFKNDEKT